MEQEIINTHLNKDSEDKLRLWYYDFILMQIDIMQKSLKIEVTIWAQSGC